MKIPWTNCDTNMVHSGGDMIKFFPEENFFLYRSENIIDCG